MAAGQDFIIDTPAAGRAGFKFHMGEAFAQGIEANNFIEQNDIPSALLDRLKEAPQFTFLNGLKGTTSFLRVETSSRTP